MVDINPIGAFSFRTAAVMISLTCIFYTTVMQRASRKRLRSRLFIVALFIILIDCITGIVNTFVMESDLTFATKHIIVYINKMIYYSTHFSFVPVFAFYIILVCDVFHRYRRKLKMAIVLGPSVLMVLAVLTNPLTGFIFSNDDTQYYSRGYGVYVAYAISALYLMFCFYLLARYWHTMNHLQKIAMFYFLALAVSGVIIQMIFPDIICELLAESLGLMGIMIMIEKDDYRLDYKTHANNRGALVHDLRSFLAVDRKFYVICIRVINAELYRRVLGYEGYDTIMVKIADFLKDIDYHFETYRTTGGNFFLLCPDISQTTADDVVDQIVDRFGQSFDVGSGSTNVRAKVICVQCPEEFSNADDILRLAEININEEDKMVFKGKDIGFLLRRIEVEKAIIRGMNDDNFKVMYQPIYWKKDYRIRSAQALLTLNDPELGKIDFAEFMSVAEDTGFVTEIEYRMIRSVCRFVKAGIEKSDTIVGRFVIHIMSVHVLKPEYVDKLKTIIEETGVNTSYIRFSVSDTIAIQAQEALSYIIDECAKFGVGFVLLNHDSGFLGLDVSTINKFEGVIIDAKRHFASSDISQGDIILTNRINMISQLGKKVVLSGIDDRKIFEKVRDIPADLIFGDYLSVMVTKNELQTKFWHNEAFYDKGT